MIIDDRENDYTPIILGAPFLATSRANQIRNGGNRTQVWEKKGTFSHEPMECEKVNDA